MVWGLGLTGQVKQVSQDAHGSQVLRIRRYSKIALTGMPNLRTHEPFTPQKRNIANCAYLLSHIRLCWINRFGKAGSPLEKGQAVGRG